MDNPAINKIKSRIKLIQEDLINIGQYLDKRDFQNASFDAGRVERDATRLFNQCYELANPKTCPCSKDSNGCVIVPDLNCEQHKNLRHRLAGGEGL